MVRNSITPPTISRPTKTIKILFLLFNSSKPSGFNSRQFALGERLLQKGHEVWFAVSQDCYVKNIELKKYFKTFKDSRDLSFNKFLKKIDIVIEDFFPTEGLIIPEHVIKAEISHALVTLKPEFEEYSYLTIPPDHSNIFISSFFQGDCGPIYEKRILEFKENPAIVKDLKDYFFIYLRGLQRGLDPTRANIYSTITAELAKRRIPFLSTPLPPKEYLKVLKNCRAIITTGGHQLPVEARLFKKPILGFPAPALSKSLAINNQSSIDPEQELNSKMSELAGFGQHFIFEESSFSQTLDLFLYRLQTNYFTFKSERFSKKNIQFDFNDGGEKAVRWLEDLHVSKK